MFRVEFRNVGQERRCWDVELPGVCDNSWARHLEKQMGLFLDWNVAFGDPAPLDDGDCGVEGKLSHNGKVIGSYRAVSISKSNGRHGGGPGESDPSDSFLFEEFDSHAVVTVNLPGGPAAGTADIAAVLSQTGADVPY